MKIHAIEGEPARYFVSSEAGEPDYLCDIEDGECDCMDFRCRVAPKLKKGLKVTPCKHLRFLKKTLNQQEQP